MIIIRVKESYDRITIGEVFFSSNPFRVPFFSEITWQCDQGCEKEYHDGQWMILYNYRIES